MDTNSTANLQGKVWLRELFADVPSILFMDKFMGSGPNNPIQTISDLKKGPGDTIEVPLTVKLNGAGVSGDSELEGNEEEIISYDFAPKIDQLRHAVRLKGRMDEKKVAYNMRADAKEKLKIWWAERIDREILSKLCGDTAGTLTAGSLHANTPTAPAGTTRKVFAGGRATEGNLLVGDVMDTKVLDKAKQLAKVTTAGVPRVRPIRLEDGAYKGTDVYIAILHSYQIADLRKDPVWAQVQRDANVRGDGNPLINGAHGIYNGVVVYESDLVYTGTDGDSSIATARGLLLGQQAGVWLEGKEADWVEKSFDYGNKWGIAAGRIFGCQKTKFNSVDYGLITLHTAADVASTA
jgi:N4-gp56 family major capsid protein